MSRFQHRVHLVELPRPLLDEVVRSLLNAVDGVPFTDGRLDIGTDFIGDVRLVEGEHLAAGARYRIDPPDTRDENPDIELRVVSWDRAGECRVEVRGEIDGHVVNVRVELRMVGRRPHTVRIEGDYQGPGSWLLRVLQRAKWEGEARFEDWWSVLGQRESPIALRVRHPLAHASLRVDRGKDENERWAAESTLRFGGRGVARPVAAVGLFFMRRRVRRLLRDAFGKAEAAWNGAVPRMVERGLQDRVTVRHRVDVKAVPRKWAEEYVAALHQAVEGLRFEEGQLARESADVRLLEGEHIEVGARYRIHAEGEADPLDVKVAAWAFDGPSRVEFGDTGEVNTGWAELDSAAKPTLVQGAISGEIQDLRHVNCTGEGNLERWWAGVGGSDALAAHLDGAAFTVAADHPLGEGTISIAGSPAKGDWWTVEVSATLEGRAWTRPLVAVAGLVGLLDDAIQWTVDDAAEKWNLAIPAATGSDPRQAADATLTKLLDEPAKNIQPD